MPMPNNVTPLNKNSNSKCAQLRIVNKSETEAEIAIYAGIGQDYWGDGSMISAKDFYERLKDIKSTVKTITIRINSPGGDVFDGIAIYNILKQHKAKKVVYIDGMAASIASIIALAGDEIYIGEGAMYMIHLPWTWTMGNRMELDNTVNLLMDIEEQMIGIYVKKSGLSRIEVKKMLEDETYMYGQAAVDKGFVDSTMEETVPIAAKMLKVPWINKKPENFYSTDKAVKEKLAALKSKVQDRLARK